MRAISTAQANAPLASGVLQVRVWGPRWAATPEYAAPGWCSLHRGWLRRSRLSQRRYRRSAASLRQHTKVAVPVGAWRWHQRGDAVDQFQRCEVQLICLGTTLVTGAASRCGKRLCARRAWGVVVALAVELTRAGQL